jgi:uncharacterized membrane protein YphA (DoxX/SURF4 family)
MTPAGGERLARLFYGFCAFAGAAVLAATVLSMSGLVPIRGAYAGLFRALIFRFGLVLAAALASSAVLARAVARPKRPEAGRGGGLAFAASPFLIRGLCVSVALAFLATEAGKLSHDAEMREFFTSSGFPVWFLYFVIAFETIGAFALLAPGVRLVAAGGLALVMVGAIATHARNGDPVTDSLEAAHLLVILVCILWIGVVRTRPEIGGADDVEFRHSTREAR